MTVMMIVMMMMIMMMIIRGFNTLLHKWILKSNRRVDLPKVDFDPRGVRGHFPPENFEVLDSRRCIFSSFFIALLFHFFAHY